MKETLDNQPENHCIHVTVRLLPLYTWLAHIQLYMVKYGENTDTEQSLVDNCQKITTLSRNIDARKITVSYLENATSLT